jgi:hypothetical protein
VPRVYLGIAVTSDEHQRLSTLAEKWDGEADNYEQRTDDDYSAHAMMLRYCAVQLRSGLIEPVKQHDWEWYMNGTFCRRCGIQIGSGRPCR